MLAVPDAKGAKRLHQARLLALIVPAGLLGGALFSQYVGGLYPCEMCYWQRWPHGAAILLALGAIASPVEAPRAPRCAHRGRLQLPRTDSYQRS